MQVFVHFQRTALLHFDDADSLNGDDIRTAISELENIPRECFFMQLDGKVIRSDDILSGKAPIDVRVSLRMLGGKGGFGAMLKSMAKRSGAKKTTDFGACRDLSGRRLRHVNDEILLKKWQDAKDRNEEFDTEQETQTGIDMWFLSAPSWADGFKSSYRKRYMRPRLKTRMCIDWMRAREGGKTAPAGSPSWWGCPRGERCEFAHGEADLRGKGKDAAREEHLTQHQTEEQEMRSSYLGYVDSGIDEVEMASAVAAGLQAHKKSKKLAEGSGKATGESDSTTKRSVLPPVPLTSPDNVLDDTNTIVNPIMSNDSPANDATDKLVSGEGPCWLRTLAGEVVVYADALVEGIDGFCTVAVPHVAIGSEMGSLENTQRWYYEVDLVTGGLFQIGWADQQFSVVGADEDGENGVGDDVHSFAYDGFRQRLWNGCELTYEGSELLAAGEAEEGHGKKGRKKRAQPGPSVAWKAGDVVGCLLEMSRVRTDGSTDNLSEKSATGLRITISYSLNGKNLGIAFSSDQNSRLQEISSVTSSRSNSDDGAPYASFLYPAITLEQGESMALNIGQRAFRYEPDATRDRGNISSVMSVLRNGGVSPSVAGAVNTISGAVHEVSLTNILTEVKASRSEGSGASFSPIDINSDKIQWPSDLHYFGLDHLKHELARRGMKTGGTLQERAERLFSVKGLDSDHIPTHLKVGKTNKKGKT